MLTQHNRDGRWRNKISVGSWSTGNGDNRTREKNYTVLRRASVFKKKSPRPPQTTTGNRTGALPTRHDKIPRPLLSAAHPCISSCTAIPFPKSLSLTHKSLSNLSLSLSHSLSVWLLLLLPPSTAPFPSDFDLRLVKADLDKPRLQTTQFVSPNKPAIQYCQEDRKPKARAIFKKRFSRRTRWRDEEEEKATKRERE